MVGGPERAAMQYHWYARPEGLAKVIKYCGHCGRKTAFYCSQNFRVNAQKKTLDVWLIYKCEACDATWNMEILSRINPCAIEASMYEGFMKNDSELAKRFASDASILVKNRAEADFDALPFIVDGEIPRGGEEALIELTCDFGVRLDKLIAQKLSLSRSAVKKLMEKGGIRFVGETIKQLKNLRVKGSVVFTLAKDALV